jgi:8-oxo-dGTP pyrophosphatase MutT (NUDIX family)
MEFYKIYIDTKKVIIADEADLNFKDNNTLFSLYDTKEIFGNLINILKSSDTIESLYVYGAQPEIIWETFCSFFTIIEAAGGLVLNKASHALLIYRHNMWDLPKGKVEKKETIEAAAVREVQEECGVKNIIIENKLITTYHCYQLKDKNILKFSHWFLMRSLDNELELVPQIIEGITDAQWLNINQTIAVLDKSYPSVRDVLTQFYIKSL